MIKTKVKGNDGQPIILNGMEAAVARLNQAKMAELKNALGYEIDITTLTGIIKRVSEQKFFTIAPADYLPVRVGDNAWSSELLTYREYSVGGAFAEGVVNQASSNGRLAEMDSRIDGVKVPVINWGKRITWNLMELNQAAKAGSWDLVTAKEKARKKNWDLGIQEVAFLGLNGNSNVKGLLTQSDVNSNTSLITGYIRAMSATNFQALVAGLIAAYRSNSNYTAMPTHFIMPEADFVGLASATSEDFPIGSKFAYLLDMFKMITGNQNFKILPLAYANQAQNASVSGLNKNRYTLLNYDEDSIRMDIPVDYTSTVQNSVDNFTFQNVGYGQFTGVQTYRPLEMLYLDWNS